jgi:hypothetical protein
MKTTAIFAELLIVGLQAIVWLIFAGLVFFEVSTIDTALFDTLKSWAALITIFVLSLSYVIGVIIDRVADSLFNQVDKKLREKYLIKSNQSVADMRLYIMSKNEGITDFLDYVRSRLRLARSTVLNVILIMFFVALWYFTSSKFESNSIIIFLLSFGIPLLTLTIFTWFRISKTYYKRLVQAFDLLSIEDDKNI